MGRDTQRGQTPPEPATSTQPFDTRLCDLDFKHGTSHPHSQIFVKQESQPRIKARQVGPTDIHKAWTNFGNLTLTTGKSPGKFANFVYVLLYLFQLFSALDPIKHPLPVIMTGPW